MAKREHVGVLPLVLSDGTRVHRGEEFDDEDFPPGPRFLERAGFAKRRAPVKKQAAKKAAAPRADDTGSET